MKIHLSYLFIGIAFALVSKPDKEPPEVIEICFNKVNGNLIQRPCNDALTKSEENELLNPDLNKRNIQPKENEENWSPTL
jgi:hypothetical protein